jgi:acyl-CoA thioester hydrolase
VLVFDQSLDQLIHEIGLTREYRSRSGCTVFVVETHVTYIREVKEGDPLEISLRVIDCDDKRMHLFLQMHHGEQGFLAATSEQMILHIDSSGPRAHPMPENIQHELQVLQSAQSGFAPPPQLGSRIGIRRKQM